MSKQSKPHREHLQRNGGEASIQVTVPAADLRKRFLQQTRPHLTLVSGLARDVGA